MSPEASADFGRQLVLPSEELAPLPVVISASRRTELVGLRPKWLAEALRRFPKRYNREIHSVVLWTKDPTNIYEHKELREELSKHNLLVHFTLTGLGGTRIEPTVPDPEVLMRRLPALLEFLGDTRRLRWRFDPIVTLEKEDGTHWSSSVLFEPIAPEIAKLGIDNCYFSFCNIYKQKFEKRKLGEAGIKLVIPNLREQIEVVEKMKQVAKPLGISLYSCVQPQLEKNPGITPAKCIDADLLIELHPQHLATDTRPDATQQKFRPACYCTTSRDIGGYFPCGHGCVYCYAEAAVPITEKLTQKPMPWDL
jgi:hypothetical protein